MGEKETHEFVFSSLASITRCVHAFNKEQHNRNCRGLHSALSLVLLYSSEILLGNNKAYVMTGNNIAIDDNLFRNAGDSGLSQTSCARHHHK
jgi:hypothetical protein